MDILDLLRGWLCESNGDLKEQLAQCQAANDKLRVQLSDAETTIKQLQVLVPRPIPPKLDYIQERDTAWVEAELVALKLAIIRLPLDGNYRLTNRKNFANIVAWDITDRMEYVRDYFDCDKFAMLFKVMTNLVFQITSVAWVIDYKSAHSYNLVLFPDSEPMVLEPQNDGLWVWTQRITQFHSLEGAFAVI